MFSMSNRGKRIDTSDAAAISQMQCELARSGPLENDPEDKPVDLSHGQDPKHEKVVSK